MLLDVVWAFFESTGWAAERHPVDQMIRATFEGENGPLTCYAVAEEDAERLLFYVVLPDLVPEERRLAVAEFAVRLNYPLSIGSFDLDFDSGEVRFRAGVDVEGGELTVGMVRSLAAASCLSLDLHRVAFEAVAVGAISPAGAAAALEG